MGRPLADVRLAVMMLDGLDIADRTHVVALGITTDGVKIPLGLWEGSTENATLARSLLSDLVDRGLDPEQAILFVIDGGKALRRAIKDVFGEHALVHRCHRHKERNVTDLLPERDRPAVLVKIRGAWALTDADLAQERLERLASELERTWPDAAGSLREGLSETLTLMRLGIGGQLAKTLCSTNPCESMIEIVRYTQRNVKRWQDGDMRKRWTAAGMLVAEQQFRRIIGYRDLATLVIAIERHAARTAQRPRPLSLTLRCQKPLLSDCQFTWRPPPKFHDDPDILRFLPAGTHGAGAGRVDGAEVDAAAGGGGGAPAHAGADRQGAAGEAIPFAGGTNRSPPLWRPTCAIRATRGWPRLACGRWPARVASSPRWSGSSVPRSAIARGRSAAGCVGITRSVRRRSGEAKAEVLKLTEQTGKLLARSVREARRLAAEARRRARGRGAQRKLKAARALEQLADRCEKVTQQIHKRVKGEKITDRLVSLWDPDARPIRKGKLGKPNEFGYVDQLCEITANTKPGARGFILRSKARSATRPRTRCCPRPRPSCTTSGSSCER